MRKVSGNVLRNSIAMPGRSNAGTTKKGGFNEIMGAGSSQQEGGSCYSPGGGSKTKRLWSTLSGAAREDGPRP